ncbi:unnamed protein product [Urochloa humidicola]
MVLLPPTGATQKKVLSSWKQTSTVASSSMKPVAAASNREAITIFTSTGMKDEHNLLKEMSASFDPCSDHQVLVANLRIPLMTA